MVAEPVPTAGGAGERIAEAALRVLASRGVARLSLDDVAREAGCSRATLYRYFPGKQALLEGLVDREFARLQAGLDGALADVATLEEALAAAAGFGAREFAGHAAVQFLLAHEPGTLLPHLCFAGADRLLQTVADATAPHLCRFLPSLQARRVSEWLARIVLSYGYTPPPGLPPGGAETTVLEVVSDFVAPAFEEDPHA